MALYWSRILAAAALSVGVLGDANNATNATALAEEPTVDVNVTNTSLNSTDSAPTPGDGTENATIAIADALEAGTADGEEDTVDLTEVSGGADAPASGDFLESEEMKAWMASDEWKQIVEMMGGEDSDEFKAFLEELKTMDLSNMQMPEEEEPDMPVDDSDEALDAMDDDDETFASPSGSVDDSDEALDKLDDEDGEL